MYEQPREFKYDENRPIEEALDENNSIHEAGHIVAILVLKGKIAYADFPDSETSKIFGGVRRGDMATPEEEMLVKLAGVAAEKHYLRKHLNLSWSNLLANSGRGDYNEIQKLLPPVPSTRRGHHEAVED